VFVVVVVAVVVVAVVALSVIRPALLAIQEEEHVADQQRLPPPLPSPHPAHPAPPAPPP
jgi:hypothetical protein